MPLQGHWPLQENSGDAHDHSGNGNTGTVSGATQGATGMLGAAAYSFDGSDDVVTTNYNGAGTSNESFTANIWLKAPSQSLSDNYLAIGNYVDSSHSGFWWIGTADGSTMQIRIRDSTESNDTISSNYSTAFDDVWHMYTFTRDHSAGTISFYIDAEFKEELSFPGNVDAKDSDSFLGFMQHNGSRNLAGDLSESRVYDHALTASEIQYLYDVGTTGTLTTETKTYASSIKPNLSANVTLDGESATAYVVGSPGTSSEETKAVTLSNGNSSYSLTWNASHTDFRIKVITDMTSPTSRVEVNSLKILL